MSDTVTPKPNRTGRPKRENRDEVAETTLTLRLTHAEKSGLEQLVDVRASELRKAYGPGVQLSMAGLIRSILVREIEAAGIGTTSEPAEPTPPPKAEPKAPATPPDAEALRARIKRALEGKAKRFDSAAELARTAGLGNNDVSRLKAGHGLAQDKLVKLDAALAGRGA
jgi:pyruvate/2-oxoglutarate dehydrogenase complex dihydrolipoamide acyltransferase (E2) component